MISSKLEKYIEEHTTFEGDLLQKLDRETHLKALYPRMLSGKVQGRFLEHVSYMVRPENILEIGTYTGYSAICLAQGLTDSGKLHTIEINPELEYISNKFIEKAGLRNKIVQHVGNALNIIPTLKEKFDIVFIDADKESYLDYYKLVFDKVIQGGFILADNALWDGKVVRSNKNTDKETTGIIMFNDYVQKDKRVDNVLLSIRDGVMMIRKK